MSERALMLGNGAIARGLLENGCAMATAYPGTPSSEILSEMAGLKRARGLSAHIQWAVNEKVAFEIAYAGAMTGLRAAVAMKQVGLNVASDPLMSAAYMGTKGGFIVISADDPGPHSSQTEQDSRMMAMMARIPALDPSTPAEAREMTAMAFELSEAFGIPVMLRPTTRVCHSRQDVETAPIPTPDRTARFEKDPARWAATPKFRLKLHGELEEKLAAIARWEGTAPILVNAAPRNPNSAGSDTAGKRAIVASGVAAAHAAEILRAAGLWERLPLYQVRQPFPLHTDFIRYLLEHYEEILLLEETMPVMEMQIADRARVRGKMGGAVPSVGELSPERIEALMIDFARLDDPPKALPEPAQAPGRRPTLCAGCPHRASFFAIRKAVPKGIYTSDIGCYTLGLNLGAVDTVLCMGAAIGQAAGFYHAHKGLEKRPDIVATIGDSTFFHAGIPPLIDAVAQGVGFTLVILDNRTTAMTGNQPTPASGVGAAGETLTCVDIEAIVRGCGVAYCKTADPYHFPAFSDLLREAVAFSRKGAPAVVIARHPCLLDRRSRAEADAAPPIAVAITEDCDGCGYCLSHFECPALVQAEADGPTRVDPAACRRCGVCVHVCPKGAIVPAAQIAQKEESPS